MALDEVLVGDNVRVTATLRYTNEDGELVAFDPDTVTVTIRDADNNVLVNGALATYLVDDVYYYDFTITEVGLHTIVFSVNFDNSPSIQITQKIYASSITEKYKPTITLRNDETIAFASEISPLYVDPEALLSIFPDASLLEIGEIIYNYSLEVKSLFKLDDQISASSLVFNILEYIRAATACELSRTYAYGGDDEVSIRLGDFSIQNRNIPRNSLSRDNASTWCQIAASLRKEILALKARGVVIQPKNLPADYRYKSTDKEIYPYGQENLSSNDPMPSRRLRSHD